MRKPIIIAVLSLSGLISSLAVADDIQLQDSHPQHHVVVKGDTLWGISAKFLKDPWRWPQLWQMNREQIKNPHLIYPGDVVELDIEGGSPRLRLVKGEQTIKLSPRVRAEALETQAIPSIPISAIGPFLTKPLIIEEGDLDNVPYIVGTDESRVIMGRGDRVYAANAKNRNIKDWSIFRQGKMLTDPDTEEPLGYEAEYVGEARTLDSHADDLISLEITRSVHEIRRDDRLVPYISNSELAYVPHAPEKTVSGRIVSAYGAVSDVGKYGTVLINRGSKDGLEAGHVLALYSKGRTVTGRSVEKRKNAWRYLDKECLKPGKTVSFDQFYDPKETLEPCTNQQTAAAPGKEITYSDIGCLKPGAKISFDQFFNPKDVYKLHCRNGSGGNDITLPDARSGLIFVYRVFDHVSYALIMNANRPVYLLDVVKNP
ncbi:MAG: LysM peptidoglycan-binding domain-containing protein [Sulfuricella denitrificans]|nr:LysM peptidoglycan-binding domain-containing protein [Sulfuricella denitrificans]